MTITKKNWLCVIPVLCWTPAVFADYKDDIGYTALAEQLGLNMPTGAGVNVTQVEASTVKDGEKGYPIYAPDINDSQFAGKTFSFPGVASTSASSHATGVASLFYGNNAMAYGIDTITSYEANEWIKSIVSSASVNTSRIANHSWVGNGATTTDTGNILRLVDRQVQHNEYIQVVGMANSVSTNPLIGSAYNVIAVGRTDGGQDRGSDAVDAVYSNNRTRPDLVAPQTTTSSATPIVSAAAAILVETGHAGGASLSNGSADIGATVYNAERSETIKAALMAGADRVTDNSSTSVNITDYRGSGHQTDNGLDDRFGAGQLNILHSYRIIAAGEQDSAEDNLADAGRIGLYGFDYDASFGGDAGSNKTATYKFDAETDLSLTASLVWNIGISNNASLTTTLHDLNLELFDVTDGIMTAFSQSAVDNTENLWLTLAMGHSYQLLVKSGEAGNFSWDYSLAWHMSPIDTALVPLPGAFYLFVSAIAGLGFAGRRKA
ncbi:hypothetical protein IVG45_19655 [Methylomonas sp. LL1]|uniref:hypothetical protein n=1 Tax=Methylomonas sp. LL1 TaxID=2785785 RepID=UPI0018C42804|nr:hypothetical protein [Methylomonas sp. LL1]QPK63004.1 hypothetical protein IVG45_19655 [Methylomonas sp. LL1]